MAQPFGHLTIPLGMGVDTSIDDKLLQNGKSVVLENAVWSRDGEVLKRNGSTTLGLQYAASTPGNMPTSWQLATHKGALVTLSTAGPRPIGVLSPSINRWVAPAGSSAVDNINGVSSKLRGQVLPKRGTVYRAGSTGTGNREVSCDDIATNGTYAAITWLDQSGSTVTMWVQFIELSTGKKLFDYSQQLTNGQASPRLVFVNGEFDLIYVNGTNLRGRVWTAAGIAAGGSGWQVSGEFTLATDVGANQLSIDVIAKGTDAYVIYNTSSNPKICLASGGVSSNTFILNVLTNSVGGALNAGNVAWIRDLSFSGKVSAIVGSTAQGVSVQWGITGGTPSASYTIDAGSGFPTYMAGVTTSSNASGEFVVVWEIATGIRWGRRFGGSINIATWILSAGLASTMWTHNSAFYMLIRYDHPEQGSFFVQRIPTNLGDATDTTRTPSARYCTGAATMSGVLTLPTVTQLPNGNDTFLCATTVKTNLVVSPGITFDTGVDTVTITFNPPNVNSPREFADGLYVCGGVLGAFDGVTYAEEGFHLFPEIGAAVQQVAGSLTLLGNYVWQACYRYTDASGRIHRSAPSDPTQSIQMTGSNRGVQITVKTLKLHGRPCRTNDGGRPGAVVIELYRTTANETATLFLTAVIDNDESVDTVTFTDTTSDGAMGAALYTTGDVLSFEAPPPALAIAPYKDRLAVVSAEDPTLIWVSFPLGSTEGPRFNSVSTVRIDDGRGDITGLAAVDDRLIVFKENAIYAVVGDGPDVNGNGSFGLAQIIGTGDGCIEPRSIVQTSDGVMFKSSSSRAGVYIVNRGLALDYISKDVHGYFQYTSTSNQVADAVHIPDLQRTEIFLLNGPNLVYDHIFKRWAAFTNQNAAAATAFNSGPVWQAASTSNLTVIAEDTSGTVFTAGGGAVEEYIETPWLSLSDLKGYERFRKVQLVGEERIISDTGDPGYTVDLSLWVNFNQDSTLTEQTRAMSVTDDIDLLELRYSSKFTAIKIGIRIKQKQGDTTNFAGPKLTALVIEYVQKQGLQKTASTNRTT